MLGIALLGLLAGIYITVVHLTSDPLADVRAYYDAGARLNSGQALYPADANPDVASFYRYPPLLAIAFRPLALLPYDMAAVVWEALVIAAFVATLRVLGLRFPVAVAVGVLAFPIGFALSIGQAHILVTLLLSIGSPWAVALAGHLKLFPWLAALYWLGRRDSRAFGRFAGWSAALAVVQFLLEPAGTVDFLRVTTLEEVGHVLNLSPYAWSPALWASLVGAGAVVTLLLARTRWGWAAAVTLASLSYPRLISYMFGTLLAGLGRPVATLTAGPQRRLTVRRLVRAGRAGRQKGRA